MGARLERIDAQGEVVTPLEAAAMEQVAERGAAAIAVCLLFSYLNPPGLRLPAALPWHQDGARLPIRPLSRPAVAPVPGAD